MFDYLSLNNNFKTKEYIYIYIRKKVALERSKTQHWSSNTAKLPKCFRFCDPCTAILLKVNLNYCILNFLHWALIQIYKNNNLLWLMRIFCTSYPCIQNSNIHLLLRWSNTYSQISTAESWKMLRLSLCWWAKLATKSLFNY